MFTGHYFTRAVLSNVDTHAYVDLSDEKCGLTATTVFGRLRGGHFVVPGLNVKFPFQPGDVIFIRSSVLTHYVTEWLPIDNGDRFSIVHFNQEDVVRYLKERN